MRTSYFLYESNLLNILLGSGDNLKPRSLLRYMRSGRTEHKAIVCKEDREVKANGEQETNLKERLGRAPELRVGDQGHGLKQGSVLRERQSLPCLFLRYPKGCATTS